MKDTLLVLFCIIGIWCFIIGTIFDGFTEVFSGEEMSYAGAIAMFILLWVGWVCLNFLIDIFRR